jgi:aryl-alcohol dehydrogenase-like predicted oxidoreductase
MYFGTRTDEATSIELLDRYVDGGGTMIDTSNNYSFWSDPSGIGGQSEALLGRWLAARPGRRDRLYLSTKVGARPLAPGGYPDNVEGLSAATIKEAVQGSLAQLGTNHVELYWAHVEDRSVPVEETIGAFGSLVSDGVVGRVGCSNWPTWRVEQARAAARSSGWPGLTALQLLHSYVQPRPAAPVSFQSQRFGWVSDETLDYAGSNDVDIWAYSPLLKGAYTHPDRFEEAYDHPGTTRRLAALDSVAAELGATRNQVVLGWLIGGSPAITPIIGVSTVAQLDEAMAGARLTLSDDQRRRLDAAA